jgi:hypothetical protein
MATAQKGTWRSSLSALSFSGIVFSLCLFGWNSVHVFRFSIWRCFGSGVYVGKHYQMD